MTLDDIERPLTVILHIKVFMEPIAKMCKYYWIVLPNDSRTFWQYKAYADIRGGSVERGVKLQWVVENDFYRAMHVVQSAVLLS